MSKGILKAPKPSMSGLECPLCGCRTLNRDVAADGWYVEYCLGGVIRVTNRELEGAIWVEKLYEFECPYADAGFRKK